MAQETMGPLGVMTLLVEHQGGHIQSVKPDPVIPKVAVWGPQPTL